MSKSKTLSPMQKACKIMREAEKDLNELSEMGSKRYTKPIFCFYDYWKNEQCYLTSCDKRISDHDLQEDYKYCPYCGGEITNKL